MIVFVPLKEMIRALLFLIVISQAWTQERCTNPPGCIATFDFFLPYADGAGGECEVQQHTIQLENTIVFKTTSVSSRSVSVSLQWEGLSGVSFNSDKKPNASIRIVFECYKSYILSLLADGFSQVPENFNLSEIHYGTDDIQTTTSVFQVIVVTDVESEEVYILVLYNITDDSTISGPLNITIETKNIQKAYVKPITDCQTKFMFRIRNRIVAEGVDCGPPTPPENGQVYYTTTTLGSQAFYSCNGDMIANSVNHIPLDMTKTCTKEEGWSGPSISCPDPVEDDCEIGYMPSTMHMENRTCDCKDGSETEPICEKICPESWQELTCNQSALIPACVNDGSGTNITELVHSSSLDGHHRFFGEELNSIHIYHNGTVKFNDGSLSIAVYLTEFTNTKAAYFLYDSRGTKYHYQRYQKEYAKCLLEASSIYDFNIIDFLVVSWVQYSLCEKQLNVTFQLALASNSTTTYAFLLYNGTKEPDNYCTPSVVTGFKAGSAYIQLLPLFGNVESLWTTSNTGINGVFIYNITGEPSSVNHESSNCGCEPPGELDNGTYEITNSAQGCWVTYQCNPEFQLVGMNIERRCNNGNWDEPPPFCQEIQKLIPYTDDYFDMKLRNDYNVQHMIEQFPPFAGRIFIYRNGKVCFRRKNVGCIFATNIDNAKEIWYFVNPSQRQFSKRREDIMNLLSTAGADGVDEFELNNMLVVTWNNVTMIGCNETIAFQIALVSDGIERTYVLLIQDHEENCEERVKFGTSNIIVTEESGDENVNPCVGKFWDYTLSSNCLQ